MNIRASALITLVCMLSVAFAQEHPDPAVSKILALENDWNKAYKDSDVAKMNSLLADNFIITIEDGRTLSKSGYIALNGTTVHVEVSAMSDVKVHMHGNTVAIVTGAYRESGANGGKRYEYRDRFTDVWMNVDGRWQLIASQYSIPKAD